MIDERPFSTEDRSEVGHFESDTAIASRRKGAIATHVDRKSRYLLASIMPNRKSDTFSNHTVKMFNDIPKSLLKHLHVIIEKNLPDLKKLKND